MCIFVLTVISITTCQQSNYNQTVGRNMAFLTAITHCPKEQVTSWNCTKCQHLPLQKVTYLQNHLLQTMGVVGYSLSDDAIYLAFRRTMNSQNMIEDLSFELMQYHQCFGCEVHLGFYTDYSGLKGQIFNAVKAIVNQFGTTSLIVGGHSLGAAISTIAALQLQLMLPVHVSLVNLGSPRVGNIEFARFVNKQIQSRFRVTHWRDAAVHLPPQSLNYRHLAYEVFYDEPFQKYKVCDSTGEDKSCANQFIEISGKYHNFYFIEQQC